MSNRIMIKKIQTGGGKTDEEELREIIEKTMDASKNVKFVDIIGLESAVEQLKSAVELPTLFKGLFNQYRTPDRGILLYGPPGTGKTMLAKAAAGDLKATFFNVTSSTIMSKYVGDAQKVVKKLFDMAAEEQYNPAVIFLDEVDTMLSARGEGDSESSRQVKNEFLTSMDGAGSKMEGVLVLAATNLPWQLDGAFMRRFQKRIYLGLPSPDVRREMIKKNAGCVDEKTKDDCDMQEGDWGQLATLTDNFSPSDISNLTSTALKGPINELTNAVSFRHVMDGGVKYLIPCSPGDPRSITYGTDEEYTLADIKDEDKKKIKVPKITMKHFIKALETATASTNTETLAQYDTFTEKYGSKGS